LAQPGVSAGQITDLLLKERETLQGGEQAVFGALYDMKI
jgi:hypothetical protein